MLSCSCLTQCGRLIPPSISSSQDGKRFGEFLNKGIGFTGVVATKEVKRVFATASDCSTKEIDMEGGIVLKEAGVKSQIACLAISSNNAMMFAGTILGKTLSNCSFASAVMIMFDLRLYMCSTLCVYVCVSTLCSSEHAGCARVHHIVQHAV